MTNLKKGVTINGVVMAEQERADMIAEMRERRMTYGQIANATGMSASNISWICLKYGIEKPGKRSKLGDNGPSVMKRGNHEVRKFTAEEDAIIRAMGAEGQRATAISKVIGRKHNSVLGRMMTLARRDEREAEAAESRHAA